MYAVIQSGGKQFRVSPGDIIEIEKPLGADTVAPKVGDKFSCDQVLFVSEPGPEKSAVLLGKPLLSGAHVEGEIVGVGRGEKIRIFKFKRRKGYRRMRGHRQELAHVLITSLDAGAGKKAALAENDRKERLSRYICQLAEKGPWQTPKTLGSRERARRAAEAAAGGEKKAALKRPVGKKNAAPRAGKKAAQKAKTYAKSAKKKSLRAKKK